MSWSQYDGRDSRQPARELSFARSLRKPLAAFPPAAPSVGEYVGRIYDEVKQRPRYLIRELRGFGALDRAPNQLFTQLAPRRSEESAALMKAP